MVFQILISLIFFSNTLFVSVTGFIKKINNYLCGFPPSSAGALRHKLKDKMLLFIFVGPMAHNGFTISFIYTYKQSNYKNTDKKDTSKQWLHFAGEERKGDLKYFVS